MIKFLKNQKQKKTYESIDKFKKPQEYTSDLPFVNISDDLHEKEIICPRNQAMFN